MPTATDGLERAPFRPAGAYWDETFGEFVLPYEQVRRAADPARAILDFAESTYPAGARLAGWSSEAFALAPCRTHALSPPGDVPVAHA